MITKEEVIQQALEAIGDVNVGVITSAELINETSQIVPFIKPEEVLGRVQFENVALNLGYGKKTVHNPYVGALSCYVSSRSRQVLKVISHWPNGVSGTRFPATLVEEKQMRVTGEYFADPPRRVPRTPFLSAAKRAIGAHTAKQIIAYYVTECGACPESRPRERPVWVINCWGMTPISWRSGTKFEWDCEEERLDSRNHLRTKIHADTGEFYSTDTVPQPEAEILRTMDST